MTSPETVIPQIEVPEDLFWLDYSKFPQGYKPKVDDIVEQLVPKVTALLEPLGLEEKNALLEYIEAEAYNRMVDVSGEVDLVLRGMYKKLFLSRLV